MSASNMDLSHDSSDDDDDFSESFNIDDDESDEDDVNSIDNTNIPSFVSIKPEEIVKLMEGHIEHVTSVVEMPATTARILLSHEKWNYQEVLDKLTDEKLDEFFERAHVLNPFSENSTPDHETKKDLTCSICFMECSLDEIVGLGCSHEYCKDCWRQYLTIKVVDDGHAESICCPTLKCGIIVDDVTVMELISDETTRQKYQHLMTNSFVQHDPSLRWCPSPGCSLAIKANNLLAHRQDCTCECGNSFCFNCGDESHDPIPCKLMKEWRKNDTDATFEYLSKNTKGCPSCDALIEKNGGCNHMRCRKCDYEFCWLCYGPWKDHGGHKCNTYKSQSDHQNDQQRFQHYFRRYSLHKKSLNLEQSLASGSVKDQMDGLHSVGMTWNANALQKALRILFESRKHLMFTYIFAFYVKEHIQKDIFEVNQNDLEAATEKLSRFLEEELTNYEFDEMAQNATNKSNYCERRQKTMQDHIFEGFENGWWSFTDENI